MKTKDELKKEFERLSLDDPESKGCAILLAELLRKRNTEIIWNWIDKAIQEAREDVLREAEKIVFTEQNKEDGWFHAYYEDWERFIKKLSQQKE